MGTWRHASRRLAVVFLIPGLFIVGAGSAGAATPALTVQPSTDLVDLQRVSVTGSGFTPFPSIHVVQCLATTVGESQCDPFTGTFPTVDASGGFTISLQVRREISATVNSGVKTDCVTVPSGCILRAENQLRGSNEVARVPIRFDPDEPALRYTISIDKKGTITNGGFRVGLSGSVTCTQPAQIGIVGNISQRKRDPNSGYPYNTFANCDGTTSWTVTIDVAPQDRPFLTGRAQVQAIAFCCQGPQLGVTRKVQLKG